MYALTNEHRRALLAELETAQADLALQKHCLDKVGHDTETLGQAFEIGEFLAQQRIAIITQAIVANEIDY